MGRGVALLLLLAATASAASPQPDPGALVGTWRGRAVFRDAPLEFTVRFFREGNALRATFSSQDLLMLEQPLDSVRYRGSRVEFATPDEQPIRFSGVLAGDRIRGDAGVPAVPGVVEHARAGADQLRFELRKVAAPLAPPYASAEIRFESAGARFAGTLLTPPSSERARPGIVILQGSSSNLRREYTFYADRFARAGFAVLSFDKRGKGDTG